MGKRGTLGRRLARRAAKLKRRLWALFLAWKDPATPWPARAVIAVAIAYAVSPIDLIPDFIPVLGTLDDLLVLPLLVALALRLIPPEVAARTRKEAWRRTRSGERFDTRAGAFAAIAVAAVWLALAIAVVLAITRARSSR